jgi:hypothetical protein
LSHPLAGSLLMHRSDQVRSLSVFTVEFVSLPG